MIARGARAKFEVTPIIDLTLGESSSENSEMVVQQWDLSFFIVNMSLNSGSPHGRQNRHLRLSNGFWRLSSRVDRQIGENGRSVASR